MSNASVIGDAARGVGVFTIDKYDQDIDEYIRLYGPVEGPIRFYRDNQPRETIQLHNKPISAGNANGVGYLWYRAMTATGTLHDVAAGLTSGVTRHWDNPINSSTAGIGVGDSTTTETGNSTDLIASSNVAYVGTANATAPSFSGNQITINTVFGGSVGNYAWQEVVAGNFSTGTTMSQTSKLPTGTETIGGLTVLTYALLGRAVQPLGVKALGTTWQAGYTLSFS